MSKKYKIGFIVIVIVAFLVIAITYLSNQNIQVLNPAGPIAQKEKNLLLLALGLSLIVVIPVFTMAILFAWKYRESNKDAEYKPDWDHSAVYESIWWGIPSLLILVLAVIAWNSSHTLDPYRPIASSIPPITIQVIAMDWKWLFIYPKENIATVNYFEIPTNTPVNFEITSDAPMNSFWVPQLSGQIYAMPGMSTQLNLEASKNGSFHGSSANISGDGFSTMDFIANSTSKDVFDQWVSDTQSSSRTLTAATYEQLARPSQNNPYVSYNLADAQLYNSVIVKYSGPAVQNSPSYGVGL